MKPISARAMLAAGLVAISSVAAQAEDVTLTLHHFVSPKAPPHAKFMAPWAEKISAESDGRIKIEIFPSMAMGGKPPELYNQVRDGAADIVWTVTGYTPGVFPRSEVFELPSVHQGSALQTNRAIQAIWPMIKEDFDDIKPLAVKVHAGNALHLADGCVDSPAALAGKKLRTPSRTGGWMIEAWGAEPVGMPLPALPQALSKGAVEGALLPFEIVPAIGVHDLTTCSVTAMDGNRFGTAIFLLAMNKDSYDALPDDLKAVIDANSGAVLGETSGVLWDSIEAGGISAQTGSGSPIEALDEASTASMLELADAVEARWIEEANSKGLDGAALVEAAKAAMASAATN
ncbi:MAG: TRAP transporter substrate-binding protein [Pseudomonadota bacterium]